jgi:hypothetical protein
MKIVPPASLAAVAAVMFAFVLHNRGPIPAPDARAPQANAKAPAPTQDATSRADESPVRARPESACNEQPPQAFLIRSYYHNKSDVSAEEGETRKQLHAAAIRYRTERYGYFPGFGQREWNSHAPSHYAEDTTFFGLTVRMHKRVIAALRCVEEEIKQACGDEVYTPRFLSGMRPYNSFHTGEITNHAYGIAIDIDPHRNICCGCLGPWSRSPVCSRPSESPYGRMDMPRCWVDSFTKYGFYWLGEDPILRDTMHFEFLGDPDKILKAPASEERI